MHSSVVNTISVLHVTAHSLPPIWNLPQVTGPSGLVLGSKSKSSLGPRLSVPDFVSQFSPKLRDKIRSGKPGFKARTTVPASCFWSVTTLHFCVVTN